MTLIDNTIKKLFGYNQAETDINSVAYMKQSIKNAPNTYSQYFEKTPKELINEFLFEQTDIARELKKIMEKLDESNKEKNS